MYCNSCRCAVCYLCVQQGRHLNHDVQALGSVSKHRKAELTHTIQSLSAKAKAGSAFVQQLKAMVEQVEESSKTCELMVTECCDALLDRLQRKRLELLQTLARDREQRVAALKEQVAHSAAHLQKTTGLLQFSVEALKEQDSVAFMQVCDGLCQRACAADTNYHKEMETRPRVSPNFCVALDNRAALHEIDTINFFQIRAPCPPAFVAEECSAHNNKVTLVWQPAAGSSAAVDAYALELDDGAGGGFREVYCGPETVCHVDGLHFDSVYTARVRCCNAQGESRPSECLRLRTSNVAWFNFERERHGDIVLSEDKLTATCSTFDDRVVLGSIGFSRGVHYWEYRVDRYDNHPDPAFGVARRNCSKDLQLGKDDLSWSMYADDQRSWFMHAGEHVERADGGVNKGTVVGVKLDLTVGELTYYINGRRHGPPVAFSDLQGVFFPAVSLNRNVQVTLRTGLAPPQHEDCRS